MPFSKLGLHPKLVQGVTQLGFTQPTAIQAEAIPPALLGKDVLACSMTGSGKTAAFGLPLLHRLYDKPRGTTRALILSPTRELAVQIVEHLKELSQFSPLKIAAVYGGVGMGPQRSALEHGADVIVATPGRLLDHMRFKYARMPGLEILVLDEADRMLDMGFLPDIERILQVIPSKRQTLFFSATLPTPIVGLSRKMLKDPVTLNIERQGKPAHTIAQTLFPVQQELKPRLCLEILRQPELRSVLVFTRTKRRADRLAKFLEQNGVKCQRIHGDRTQGQRMEALKQFKQGRIRVLVATDVAARGIDIDALSHVINFDVPKAAEDYVHRVGRTGRAELTGDAFTFVAPHEESSVRDIERAVGKRIMRAKTPDLHGQSSRTQQPEPAHATETEQAELAGATAGAEQDHDLHERGPRHSGPSRFSHARHARSFRERRQEQQQHWHGQEGTHAQEDHARHERRERHSQQRREPRPHPSRGPKHHGHAQSYGHPRSTRGESVEWTPIEESETTPAHAHSSPQGAAQNDRKPFWKRFPKNNKKFHKQGIGNRE